MALALKQDTRYAAEIEFWQIKPMLASVTDQIDIDALLHGVGLRSTDEHKTADSVFNLATYFRIQRDIARALDDLTLHLSSRKLTYQTGNFVVDQMKRAVTLKDAVQSLSDYFNIVHGDAYNSVRQSETYLTLVIDDSSFPYTHRDDDAFTRFVGDCVVIKVHCLLDSLSNGLADRALRSVGLQRTRGEKGSGQNAFWDVPLRYQRPAYELTYDFDLACKAIRPPEEIDLSTDGIFARVISYLQKRDTVPDNRTFSARTLELVSDGCVQQDKVASQLGISVATLRRRLTDEASSFRDLVHQVRFEKAKVLLEQGRSVSQVSEALEYSDIRAFNRAFKKWVGVTPSAFARSST